MAFIGAISDLSDGYISRLLSALCSFDHGEIESLGWQADNGLPGGMGIVTRSSPKTPSATEPYKPSVR